MDIAHLEKMGRELECPICLSLLDSAISLTCNHVFCNSCILKFMKSGSSCPVCKVPFRRREVRPAPHMDNLVNICKSMEVASGISIFTTQTAPSTKISDGQDQGEDKNDLGNPEIGGTSSRKSKKQRKFKRKSTEQVKTNSKNSGPLLLKRSFPAKKRVQVPQYPLSEAPTRPEKFVAGLGESVEKEPMDSSVQQNKKPIFTEMGEPKLSPFFWLKEYDDREDEFCSQHTEGDIVTDTPVKGPSFSDLKDSDDETPTKMTVNGEVQKESKVVHAFDSEMFEWTQRACSPELCSTPGVNVPPGTREINKDEPSVIQEERDEIPQICTASTHEGVISENLRIINAKHGTENKNVDLPISVPTTNKSPMAQNPKRKSTKTAVRTIGRSQSKRVKLSLDGVLGEVPINSNEIENEGSKRNSKGNSLNLVGKTSKRAKKTSSTSTVSEKTPDVPTKLIEAKIMSQGADNLSADLAVPSNDENVTLRCKPRKGSDIINAHHEKKPPKTSNSQRVGDAITMLLNEVPMNQNQGFENMNTRVPISSFLKDKTSETPNLGEKTDTVPKIIKTKVQREKRGKERLNNSADAMYGWDEKTDTVTQKVEIQDQTAKGGKQRLKNPIDVMSKDGSVDEAFDNSNKDAAKETESIKNLKETPELKANRRSDTDKKILAVANGRFLRKCETLPNKIQCGFCQSFEDSKASGEMMHYFRGKPVASDYDGGSNVMHSHKNCTEWAPNVYFEDDTAVNLETELARSRRIKCSYCGIKGAALGCYEKSCRKSFHVPCAKLVPQCRWDAENFVILCPYHASSKLPFEISGHQQKRRKRSIPKGESHAQKTQVLVEDCLTVYQQWRYPRSSIKWVLCCSALTVAEKDTVSEFAKLAGLSVSKTWCSSVTHIIASTDENGACKRTLKFLMGVLKGKWILKIDWIKACMDAMEPVDEVQYEINKDIHGIRNGPQLGRLRVLNKQPKLFNGFTFYFMGEFVPSYKGYLQDLVVAAGGTVLQRKPISRDQGGQLSESSKSTTLVIYSLELADKCDPINKTEIWNRRRGDAEALANSTGAKVATNSWVLDSIAACKLQNLP
ncbi:protein BREAST CANCER SUSCEPTIBILITY 1 homolog [Macadamia integrifolia]|uniref:protein BREAST CANCER SUSCEPTIBILITY 1 homolog n=1 Tax=Macadamia integrifolia TaxID=60698 RepID=UPI001C4E3D28|nr:protein BREAST CANCER SUSCEPTIBILITY 1 homolog [Macadamia integrifolia]